jgi:hypothetical protein
MSRRVCILPVEVLWREDQRELNAGYRQMAAHQVRAKESIQKWSAHPRDDSGGPSPRFSPMRRRPP